MSKARQLELAFWQQPKQSGLYLHAIPTPSLESYLETDIGPILRRVLEAFTLGTSVCHTMNTWVLNNGCLNTPSPVNCYI